MRVNGQGSSLLSHGRIAFASGERWKVLTTLVWRGDYVPMNVMRRIKMFVLSPMSKRGGVLISMYSVGFLITRQAAQVGIINRRESWMDV